MAVDSLEGRLREIEEQVGRLRVQEDRLVARMQRSGYVRDVQRFRLRYIQGEVDRLTALHARLQWDAKQSYTEGTKAPAPCGSDAGP